MTASFEQSSRWSLATSSSTSVGVLARLHCRYNLNRRCFRFSAASSDFMVIRSWYTLSSTSLSLSFWIVASFRLMTWFRRFTFSVFCCFSLISFSLIRYFFCISALPFETKSSLLLIRSRQGDVTPFLKESFRGRGDAGG